jgi:hypothetical protein
MAWYSKSRTATHNSPVVVPLVGSPEKRRPLAPCMGPAPHVTAERTNGRNASWWSLTLDANQPFCPDTVATLALGLAPQPSNKGGHSRTRHHEGWERGTSVKMSLARSWLGLTGHATACLLHHTATALTLLLLVIGDGSGCGRRSDCASVWKLTTTCSGTGLGNAYDWSGSKAVSTL